MTQRQEINICVSESAHETREEEQKSGEMDKNGRNQGGGLKRRQMDRTVEITSGRSRETQCRRPLTNYFNLHLKSILPRRDVSRLHLHLQNSVEITFFPVALWASFLAELRTDTGRRLVCLNGSWESVFLDLHFNLSAVMWMSEPHRSAMEKPDVKTVE